MKKIAFLLGSLLLAYIIFFDLQVGTIPTKHIATVAKATKSETKSETKSISLPKYEKIQVKNGDTVLGIIEDLNPDFNQPISQITKDFSALNNGLSPTKIQSGKSYKFPIYSPQK
ncbi:MULTISPECIES: hypothetical protein [unclassified Bacillus (in: firmicutes)]|uniref:hypothetical protein n=1 Tax=unclassified Bacillus (in: firmicutes) TaxID=185979 RepID=UPI0008E4A756|nr:MULTISPECIES: hypothetical protein [unclassified Bacillus (in: firmicutes)]PGZ92019.1 hypothetical protein COE53_11645 [Bacillus sp. AFS029533]SFD57692.1 hypothetical protein SAMN02799633_04196 [Bacillus sp. UNCCL81]